MKFAEMLDEKNLNKSTKIFDGTDGNFAFFSKIPTYHVKVWLQNLIMFLRKKNIKKIF